MSGIMNAFWLTAELCTDGLWRASWQGAIAIAIVLAIARWCTFLSPRIVCWLWRLACLKMLVALLWSQPLSLAVLPAAPTEGAAAKPALFSAAAHVAAAESPLIEELNLPPAPHLAEQGGLTFRDVLFLLWLAGVSYGIGGIARQWNSMRRLLSSASIASSDLLNAIGRQEAERLRVCHPPRLYLSSCVESPLLTGVWRPAIVLSAFVQEAFDAPELRLMLAHELAHHRRRDLLWNWLPVIVRTVFFFHPLVWVLVRSWSEAQEAACDELLIQSGVAQRAEYGRLLLKLAVREPIQSQPRLAAAGVLGAYRNLERRILAMTRVKPSSFRHIGIAAALLSLLATFGLIPWRLVAQESPRTTALAHNPADSNKSDRLPGKIYVWAALELKSASDTTERYRGVIAIDPNTGKWEKVGPLGQMLRVSPDARRAAFTEYRKSGDNVTWDLFLADIDNPQPARLVEDVNLSAWSPDGHRLLYRVMATTQPLRGATWEIDLTTKEKHKLPIPETDGVNDWSPQGDWLVTVSDRHPPIGSGYQLYVMHPDGADERRITQGEGLNVYPRFSGDGKHLVYDHQRKGEDSLWVVDIDGSNARQVASERNDHDEPSGACWSPDNRWLAVRLVDWELVPGQKHKSDSNWRIELIAVDGSSRRSLDLHDVVTTIFLQIPDWR